MNINIVDILESVKQYDGLIFLITTVIVAIRAVSHKIMTRILMSAMKWIGELQDNNTLSGPEKMELLLHYIKDFIPRFFNVIFSDKVLESITDSVYEDMKKYSETRVETKTGLTWQQMVETLRWLEDNSVSTDSKEETKNTEEERFKKFISSLSPEAVEGLKEIVNKYPRQAGPQLMMHIMNLTEEDN